MRRRRAHRTGRMVAASGGFTLIELLVVMVIIITLLGAVLAGSSVMVTRAKNRSTQSVLSVVLAAVDQFKNEQSERPTITRANQGGVIYNARYGLFPPDELEVFTGQGLPGATAGNGTLAPGGAQVVLGSITGAASYDEMQFYTAGNDKRELEHRDLAAMVLAIELNSEVGAEILAKLSANNRDTGPVDASGDPLTFLHRGGGASWDVNSDQQISYILDGWGVPLAYFSQQDYDPGDPAATESSNHRYWNAASSEMVHRNGGQPIIMSYGPNGKEQLTQDAMQSRAISSMVVDWNEGSMAGEPGLANPLNEDNIYAHLELATKLKRNQ